eukprot:gnl/Carplike_NY0171/936_a1286_1057.p1 GENE.gnl/Carplike_NY0171/936_a1286_1057~~gnl/Carplike_NY0171/936_a1286_1057.p1  ORF type:complete len:442 (+),score=115.16 gnl/Carplike_NY0171/936_a1286_1057:120-1328(+)
MFITKSIDPRLLDKYKQEASKMGRDGWVYAYAMDTSKDERSKGKTVEVGRAMFATENRRFTLLDAPGHKGYVPNMVVGTMQADVGVLIISARRGEFETGFEKGGQSREHAIIAKTCGVRALIVAINKMDDPTVEWSQERYDEIVKKVSPFLKGVGFPKSSVRYIPISGWTGKGIAESVRADAPWFDSDETLIHMLDTIPMPKRDVKGQFRMPVLDRFRHMGVCCVGKVERGSVVPGDKLALMPGESIGEVTDVFIDEQTLEKGEAGDNLCLRLKGIPEEELRAGTCLCATDSLCHFSKQIICQFVLLEHRSLIAPGYRCVMHIHTASVEVTVHRILALLDKKTKKIKEKLPKFATPGNSYVISLEFDQPQCVEMYSDFERMGRFLLRDEDSTIGIGVITKVK